LPRFEVKTISCVAGNDIKKRSKRRESNLSLKSRLEKKICESDKERREKEAKGRSDKDDYRKEKGREGKRSKREADSRKRVAWQVGTEVAEASGRAHQQTRRVRQAFLHHDHRRPQKSATSLQAPWRRRWRVTAAGVVRCASFVDCSVVAHVCSVVAAR
jgi:hypothetical protein